MQLRPVTQRYRRLWIKLKLNPLGYFRDSRYRLLRICVVPLIRLFQRYPEVLVVPVYATYDARWSARAGRLANSINDVYLHLARNQFPEPDSEPDEDRSARAGCGYLADRMITALRRMVSPYSFNMKAVPLGAIQSTGPDSFSTAFDSSLDLEAEGFNIRSGWLILSFELEVSAGTPDPTLYLDFIQGPREYAAIKLPQLLPGRCVVLMRVPGGLRAARFRPMEGAGRFSLSGIRMSEVSPYRAFRFLRKHRRAPVLDCVEEVLSRSLLDANGDMESAESYASWIETEDTLSETDVAAIRTHIMVLSKRPLISVITPVFNTAPAHLMEMIQSVKNQIYENWELCIVDDGSDNKELRPLLECESNSDARIHLNFMERNGGITVASNQALQRAKPCHRKHPKCNT